MLSCQPSPGPKARWPLPCLAHASGASVQNASQDDRLQGVAVWAIHGDASRLAHFEAPIHFPDYLAGLWDLGDNMVAATNQGTAIGTQVAVECLLQSDQALVKSSGATAARQDGRAIQFAPLRSLAPQQKVSWRVVVAGPGRLEAGLKSD